MLKTDLTERSSSLKSIGSTEFHHCKDGTRAYRYGFNGKENDDEVFGDGRFIAYEERIYDPSISRFYSTDPKEFNYPWQSTYCYFRNSPIGIYDYKGAGEPFGPENLNICEINPDVALEQDAPSQIIESNSRTYDGTIAHRAFTQYIRRNFPSERPWKCNRNINGKDDRSRPDLIYFSPDQRLGGVWEIKPIETILTGQAQNDVDYYVENLNKLG
ncbi:MAG: hypothetical protein L6Q78_04970 [Bacteroidia bacterium]|nr:hypothetical protein [Bacteroidia bacterium]